VAETITCHSHINYLYPPSQNETCNYRAGVYFNHIIYLRALR